MDEDGSVFVALRGGGAIPLGTFGQGASHASLMIEVEGFGEEAWIDVYLHNLDAVFAQEGDTLDTQGFGDVSSIDSREPEVLACDDGGVDARCVRGPVAIITSGLAAPDQMEGLHVMVTAKARNREGVTGEGSADGYLRWPDEDEETGE